MDKIKILAGDLSVRDDCFISVCPAAGLIQLARSASDTMVYHYHVLNVTLMTEEKIKKVAGTAGWGLAGAALLGPIGAIGGMLLGGNKTESSFLCETHEGDKFLGITDVKVFQQLVAASMSSAYTDKRELNMTLGEMKERGDFDRN